MDTDVFHFITHPISGFLRLHKCAQSAIHLLMYFTCAAPCNLPASTASNQNMKTSASLSDLS